ITTLARSKLPSTDAAPAEEGETSDGMAASGGGGEPAVTGAIRSRGDALELLLKVADFFRRPEPHTPGAHALEPAGRGGRMALPDLLADLIQDESARQALFHRVGIRPNGEGS